MPIGGGWRIHREHTSDAGLPTTCDRRRQWNLAPLIPDLQRYSRVYHGQRELIDHIMVSHALLGRVQQVRIIVDPPLPSVTDDPGSG